MKLNLDALEVARQRNRLTKSAFASLLDLSSRDLRRMREVKEVDPDFITRIAEVTGFPVEFFSTDENLEISKPTFRKQATLSARERDAGEAAAKIAKLFWKQVEREYTLPAPNLPDYSSGECYLPSNVDRAIYAAAMLREEWGLGTKPIGNFIQLLEKKGIRVLSLSEPNTRGLSAFTFWEDGSKPFVYLNMVGSTERSRFDAAHELAHLVLHRNHDAADPKVEEEADRFASAFLIPKADLLRYKSYPTLSNLRKNKKRWNVSVSALVRAYRDNGLIDGQRYKYLNIELSRKGWRTKEPDQSPRELSGTWKYIKMDLWKRSQTVEDLAKRAKIPHKDAAIFTSFGGANGQPDQMNDALPKPVKGKPQLRVIK